MTLSDYLSETFVRNALIAATLVAVTAGAIGPMVIVRDLAFAVHGTAELSFTGAAAGLLVAGDPLLGALAGSIVVATAIGLLGKPCPGTELRDRGDPCLRARCRGIPTVPLSRIRHRGDQHSVRADLRRQSRPDHLADRDRDRRADRDGRDVPTVAVRVGRSRGRRRHAVSTSAWSACCSSTCSPSR